ncbi:MAG: GNAT family N-acetyltransferase [Bacillaceae bacterium]
MNIQFEKITRSRMDVIREVVNSNPVYNEFELGEQLRTDEQLEEAFFQELTHSYFIKLDDTYVGIVNYMENLEDTSIWIGMFIIHRDYQGFGIGTNAYYMFEQFLKEKGFQRIHLIVGDGYECGIRFWKGVGFSQGESYKVDESKTMRLEKQL